MRRFFVLISSMLSLGAGAQDLGYYLPANVTYDPKVPTPEQVIGHHVGEWHVTHDRLVNYMKAVAAAAPSRVSLVETGHTYEARPQLVLIFTSQANHSRLETIRQEHLKLSDPAYTGALDTEKMPTVLWQGFSIHGNEPSGANAALLGAYYLAAAQGPYIDSLLNEVVVLFDPAFNPDGLNRFATWANMHKSQHLVTDPASREFNEVWPGGRYNHYWFDLNRDWLPAQHLESRNRLKIYQQWRPNILTDHHEMGSDATFFFQPGEPSRVNPLTPVKNQQLTQAIADYHAAFLNKIGSLYYTKEGYDDFYYGKGSTYPDAQGCIGILFEQASSRGHAQETPNGILSFPFTIRNQFNTVLSTLAAAKGLRKELLNYQRDFYRQMAKDAAASAVKGWVFGAADDESRNHLFVEMLQRHEIKVNRLSAPVTVGAQSFEAGRAYVVPVNQPQYKLIRTFFEKTLEYKDSIFYDITAWTMPLAMGLPYEALNAAQFGAIKAETVASPANSGGQMAGGMSHYAYAFEWTPLYAPRMLNKLLKEGINAKVVSNPFTANVNGKPKKFGYGTILIPIQLQKEGAESLFNRMKSLAAANNVDVYAINNGMSMEGSDLGSRYMLPLTDPSVAMLVGTGVSALDAGEVWHLLDQRFEMPPTMLEAGVFNRISLNRYKTIILVSGNYAAFNKEKLSAWVQAGGNLLLMEDAISWAQQNGLVKLAMKKLKPAIDSGKSMPYVSLPFIERAQQLSGAILGAEMDLTHPLCYGYTKPSISLFKQNRVFMEKPSNPFAAPVGYGSQPLLSGYVTRQNLDAVKESAAVVVQAVGAGRVISIAENPNFRAYWLGGAKLFLNAIFFGNLISAGSARAEE